MKSRLAILNELVYRLGMYDRMAVVMTLGLDSYIRSLYARFVKDRNFRILDIGTGTGRNIPYIYTKALNVICVDISYTALKICLNKYRNLNNIDIICCSGEMLAIKDRCIDTILTSYTLRHLNIINFIHEICRVTHKDSRVIIVDFWKSRTTFRRIILLVHLSIIVTLISFLICPFIVNAYINVWKEIVKLPNPNYITRLLKCIGNVKFFTIVDIIYIWILDL